MQDTSESITPAWDMGHEWGYNSAARIIASTGLYAGISNDAYDAIAPKIASFLHASTAEEATHLNLGVQVGIMQAIDEYGKRTIFVGVPSDEP